MQSTLLSRFTGCLIGEALGDAVGELAFSARTRDLLDSEVEKAELLRYTDDTAMALGIAQCLVESGSVAPEPLGRIFHANYSREPWRGYASGPPSIFARVQAVGIKYSEAASALFGGRGSFGNGSAMRVAPVGLFYHKSPELYERACESAMPTHTHPLALDGAAVQAKAVALAIGLPPGGAFSPRSFLEALEGFARTTEFRSKIRLALDLILSGASDPDAARTLGKSVAVHESLPFSLYSFAKYPASFRECIYCAVLNGGDRDTMGAMAGAISGAYLGVASLPGEWREKLENSVLFSELAASLMHNLPLS
ncbi:MAG: ADP-ribosylglycohydrolase family protein [Desulfobacteraceae bacterium]|nr:ADP-ribosylglycohydrolase family protein [Desulfobacteraceae bacterium]